MSQSVLYICPYDHIYPPMNGGMQRCFNILHQLSKYFTVHAIIHQDDREFDKAKEDFPSLSRVKFYSTKHEPAQKDLFSLLPVKVANALRYRWIKRSIQGATDSSFLLYYELLRELLKKEKFDFIILENLATVNAVKIIRRLGIKVPVIYNAHNIDTTLAKDAMQKGLMEHKTAGAIEYAEKILPEMVDAILVCSEHDKQGFEVITKHSIPISIIPNAVNMPQYKDSELIADSPGNNLIFCGSLDYYPNVEALQWFYISIWPAVKKLFPLCKLILVGGGNVPESLKKLSNDPSVLVAGRVEEMGSYYKRAAVALAPILTGSGTRLKILEAMSYGLPVVSTRKGAEGIEYSNKINIVLADGEEEFISEICNLLADEQQRKSIGNAGRQLITAKYTWDKVGETLYEFLN